MCCSPNECIIPKLICLPRCAGWLADSLMSACVCYGGVPVMEGSPCYAVTVPMRGVYWADMGGNLEIAGALDLLNAS
jgi:hypothetical protein